MTQEKAQMKGRDMLDFSTFKWYKIRDVDRGKSPSGVIEGVHNDAYRGNDSYHVSYRDWDADA
jgi:hypothetical protein